MIFNISKIIFYQYHTFLTLLILFDIIFNNDTGHLSFKKSSKKKHLSTSASLKNILCILPNDNTIQTQLAKIQSC